MPLLGAFLVVGGLSIVGAVASAQTLPDATVADPDAHKVMLENERVRVLQVMAAVGHKTPMHSHQPFAFVSLGTARVRFTYQDGKQEIGDLRPGTVVWIDGVEHSWEVLAGQVDLVAVEVKSAKAAKAAKAN